MIDFAFKFNDKIKVGVLNSDNPEDLMYNIAKGCKFWNLNVTPLETINDNNYAGIGVSELHLRVEEDNA